MLIRRLWLLIPLVCFKLQAANTLTITDLSGNKTVFTAQQLLVHPEMIQLTLKKDVVYPSQRIEYSAIPVYSLINKSKTNVDSVIQFKATDGFSGPLPQEKLLNKDAEKSIAYVAIESNNQKWPMLQGRNFSAGPFYLVWKNPHLSNISDESWPFQLAEFEIKTSFETTYPNAIPAVDISKTSDIYAGFQSFVRNCFVCHKMNNEGEGVIGPDLNVPMNPTEYFKDEALKNLIRNPASIRTWSNQLMGAFPESLISNEELEHLVEYLHHMSKRKVSLHKIEK